VQGVLTSEQMILIYLIQGGYNVEQDALVRLTPYVVLSTASRASCRMQTEGAAAVVSRLAPDWHPASGRPRAPRACVHPAGSGNGVEQEAPTLRSSPKRPQPPRTYMYLAGSPPEGSAGGKHMEEGEGQAGARYLWLPVAGPKKDRFALHARLPAVLGFIAGHRAAGRRVLVHCDDGERPRELVTSGTKIPRFCAGRPVGVGCASIAGLQDQLVVG